MHKVTTKLTGAALSAFVLAIGLAAVPMDASGQAEPLGDEFIIFVNGTNLLIPSSAATPAEDPDDPDNTVAQYDFGDFFGAWWELADRGVGVDMSQNQMDGDTLFLRLWSSPDNLGQPNISISMLDKTDDSGADDGTADHEFRLQWIIPDWAHNGAWHDLAIPFPPATYQELEDAKGAGTLDSLAAKWVYGGAWSAGGFPVALDGLGPNTTQRPDLWREFEWDAVRAVGPFYDNNSGGGRILLDNVYIGSVNTDLSVAVDPPPAFSGVTFSEDGPDNVVSWMHDDQFGGYNVYASDAPITDVRAMGVTSLATIPFDAESFEVRQRVELPHITVPVPTAHFAVTSLSLFGVENTDVSNSSGSITNSQPQIQPSVLELTDAEGDMLFDNLSNGVASPEGFPDIEPFVLDSNHRSLGDASSFPDSDADLSGSFWIGYTSLNELWIYAEVTDDVNEFAPEGTGGGGTWEYDSIELGWGNYDVRDAGGTLFSGSPHQDMMRGDLADYQFRIAAQADTTGAGGISSTSTFIGWSLDAEAVTGGTAIEELMDGGTVVGYKSLSLVPLDGIQASGDAVLDPPTGTDIRFVAMNIALNDADGSGRLGAGGSQIMYSVKANADGQWWNTPAQWPTTAMAGRGTATSTDEEGGLPETFALHQNYPNPFRGETTLRFTIPETDRVTLSVYNLLGQRVATLVDDEPMSPGAHAVPFDAGALASGLYMYKLESGSNTQTKQMLLIK